MSEENNGGCTWPEQDAIDIWIKKHNIAIVHQHTLELKNEVTKPRIEVQDKLEKANKELEQYKAVVDAVNGEITCLLQIADRGIHSGMVQMRSSESEKQTHASVKALFEALSNLKEKG